MAALAVLASIDIALRLAETSISGNARQIAEFPARAEVFSATPAKPALAVIGNSLAGEGIRPRRLSEELRVASEWQPEIQMFSPDASNIWEWYCIVSNTIKGTTSPPQAVIIGFGWDQLSDQADLNLSRAFNSLCPLGSLMRFSNFRGDVGVGTWIEAGFVKISKLYAQRSAIRNGLLRRLIPGYEAETQRINRSVPAASAESGNRHRPSYAALVSLVEQLNAAGTSVTLLAMPVVTPYPLDPGLCHAISRLDARLLDMRHVEGIDSSMYRDPIHLDDSGAAVFSVRLAAKLSPAGSAHDSCTDPDALEASDAF